MKQAQKSEKGPYPTQTPAALNYRIEQPRRVALRARA